MKNTKYFIITFILLASVGLASVSNCWSSTWGSLRKKVVGKYSDFHSTVNDMAIEQEVTAVMESPEGVQQTTSSVLMYHKGDKYRMESTVSIQGMGADFNSVKSYVINDGTDLWSISPYTGKQKIQSDIVDNKMSDVDWWGLIPAEGKILGTETIGGFECFLVEFQNNEEYYFNKVWIEKNDFLLVKTESENDDGLLVMRMLDYKAVKGGWKWPFRTQVHKDDTLIMESKIKSFKINSGISDSLFDPDSIKVDNKSFNYQQFMNNTDNSEGAPGKDFDMEEYMNMLKEAGEK